MSIGASGQAPTPWYDCHWRFATERHCTAAAQPHVPVRRTNRHRPRHHRVRRHRRRRRRPHHPRCQLRRAARKTPCLAELPRVWSRGARCPPQARGHQAASHSLRPPNLYAPGMELDGGSGWRAGKGARRSRGWISQIQTGQVQSVREWHAVARLVWGGTSVAHQWDEQTHDAQPPCNQTHHPRQTITHDWVGELA